MKEITIKFKLEEGVEEEEEEEEEGEEEREKMGNKNPELMVFSLFPNYGKKSHFFLYIFLQRLLMPIYC